MCTNLRHAVLISARFSSTTWSQLSVKIKCNFSADSEDLDQFSDFHEASTSALTQNQNMREPCALVKRSEFWVVTMTHKWPKAIFWVKHSPTAAMTWRENCHALQSKIMWKMIPPIFNCPNQHLRLMHTKPKMIWGGILFPYTLEQIRPFWVLNPITGFAL